ncbi:hypothetical protein BTM29_07345 [Companilactobacillus allii]|uniref:Competence protein ComGC n=1 Tax=Companilactobacillus allii TaxID=1847728 RepID=A0A1P8Q3G4_9LACO|nr:competence type IV pilus major pilin ComGC [Companilactobacillus allii]APX72386.1 hypothetical protein BTM29_07345 [Companilactobacillus allii]
MKKIINKTKKGFTLIEMVIVLFIISLLLLIMIPNLARQKQDAAIKGEDAFRVTMQTQVDMYDGADLSWNKLKAEGLISDKQAKEAMKKFNEVSSDKKKITDKTVQK